MLRHVLFLLSFAALLLGCKRSYDVGDHVLVEWEGKDYPAVIVSVEGPAKFKVHYDGYDDVWDEEVPRARIKGEVPPEGVIHPEPPPKVQAKALEAAQTNLYKISDKVRVEWHGQLYPAQIIGIVGREKYRVHYDGYGDEWDETVGLSRIQPK
jgi:hypothetical protein